MSEPAFHTVQEYDAKHEWMRQHLVPNGGDRTKCGLFVPSLTQMGESWASIKCPHCPNIAPRFGDGFTMQAGVPTAQFTLDFLQSLDTQDYSNTRDHAIKIGLADSTFDTALPMDWYDDVHRLTGVWPQSLGFVWSYEVARINGEPVPLTVAAYIVLGWYLTARKLERALS